MPCRSNDTNKLADWVTNRLDAETVFGDARTERDLKVDPFLNLAETLEPADYEDAHAAFGTDRSHLAPARVVQGNAALGRHELPVQHRVVRVSKSDQEGIRKGSA